MGLRNWFFESQKFKDLATQVDSLALVADGIAAQFPVSVDNVEVLKKLELLTKPQMSIWFDAGKGKKNDVIDIPVYVKGENMWEIKSFGLHLLFDVEKFQFIEALKSELTADWNSLAGNEATPGDATIGGFMGAGSPIVGDSAGVLFIVKLKVLVDGFTESNLIFHDYVDDISGMKPNPVSRLFIYE